ncbi:hypothetical protein ATERTT37_003017 [Aspergillus terreus]
MTEIAGLILGTAALWETCVQIFDVVESGRRYGMDYELLRVKLEVERIRLYNWGDAIGLSECVNRSDNGTTSMDLAALRLRLDVRLRRVEVNHTVMRLLGCIQHLFQDLERVQDAYGLRPATPVPETPVSSVIAGSSNILSAVFAKSYESLKRSARERQKTTTMARRTKWAIHDKKKFQDLVLEIRGFNDSLESLFPGSKQKIAEFMRVDVEASENVEELQLLQNATIGDHADISDLASIRLEELGAPATERTALLSDRNDSLTVDDLDEENWEDVEETEHEDDNVTATVVDSEVTVGEKRVNAVQRFINKKRTGALRVHLLGPFGHTPKVYAVCYWENKEQSDMWVDDKEGFVSSAHAAFEPYHKRRYKRQQRLDEYDIEDESEDDGVLFDLESYPEYETAFPGTVTVKGLALEAWVFAISHSDREDTIPVTYPDLGRIPAKKLLRRIDKLQTSSAKFGWNPTQDQADLEEFTGDMGFRNTNSADEYKDIARVCSGLFMLLNRTDVFVDFRSTSSIFGAVWSEDPERNERGFWNLLWQVIVAKELVRRLEVSKESGFTSNFTGRILASMIIADQWIKNIEIGLSELRIRLKDVKPPETKELKAKAENSKLKGNDAMAKKDYHKAICFYTEAISIDPSSAVYRANRSAANLSLELYSHSFHDAYIATLLDVKYAKAWSRAGLAALKLGLTKKAVDAYKNAIALAGKDATAGMRRGLEDAKAADKAKLDAIDQEQDLSKREGLRKEYIEQDYESQMGSVELHSRCHEQQVEGLIHFAERMKWPWVNDVRDFAEEAYSNLRGGQPTPVQLEEWLYGLTLPGQWFSIKIMSALIFCTPTLATTLRAAPYYDCGLSLPKKSYWRVRTVLGRVLGSLPGVTSLCGWLGPCPPVEFLQTGRDDQDDFDPSKPRHIKLKARAVNPIANKDWFDDIKFFAGEKEDIHPDGDEEFEGWRETIEDRDNWIVPEPPVHQVSTCSLTKIQLKYDLSGKYAAGIHPDAKDVYRAQLAFTIDTNPTETITYKLYTNPIFVVPPPCQPGPRGVEHEVHLRELPRYQERNIWTIERLKEHTAEDDPERGGVMVINATGKGAETLARAWCSERGKNAVIRRSGGPCFVCAVEAASQRGLGTKVLIWVS